MIELQRNQRYTFKHDHKRPIFAVHTVQLFKISIFIGTFMYIYWYYVHVFNFLVYMKSAAAGAPTPRLTTTGIAIAMTTININFTNTVKHHNMFGLELNS